MPTRNPVAFGLIVCLLASFVGCREPDANLVPVSGTLTIKGVPAGSIMIKCMPDIVAGNKGPTSSATTNDKGEFTLTVDSGETGAVLGQHKVVFFDLLEERPAQGETVTSEPRINSALSTTAGGMTVTISSGEPLKLDIEK